MKKLVTQEVVDEIKKRLEKGETQNEIAKAMGIERHNMSNWVWRYINNGHAVNEPRKKRKPQKRINRICNTQENEKSVNCTKSINETCIYGSNSKGTMCNYFFCTGCLRGGSPKECKHYIKGKPIDRSKDEFGRSFI